MLEIRIPSATVVGLVADRRLYLSADGHLCEDGSPDARVLLATPGWIIPAEDVARLGLSLADGRIMQGQPEPIVEEVKPIFPPEVRRRKEK